MLDDWKGEHLIKAAPSKGARKSERQRLISAAYHRERRERGEPAPAARQHSMFMKITLAEMRKGE